MCVCVCVICRLLRTSYSVICLEILYIDQIDLSLLGHHRGSVLQYRVSCTNLLPYFLKRVNITVVHRTIDVCCQKTHCSLQLHSILTCKSSKYSVKVENVFILCSCIVIYNYYDVCILNKLLVEYRHRLEIVKQILLLYDDTKT